MKIMKVVKYIVISVFALVLIILAVAALMPKDYSISSQITINKPRAVVFDYIRMLRNQEKYSKWVMADREVKIIYTGVDGTVGAKSSWISKKKEVGEGEQVITKVMDGEGYKAEMKFIKPEQSIGYWTAMTTSVSDSQTMLSTTFSSTMPYPVNLMIPMISKMLHTDMDENNRNVKAILEH